MRELVAGERAHNEPALVAIEHAAAGQAAAAGAARAGLLHPHFLRLWLRLHRSAFLFLVRL